MKRPNIALIFIVCALLLSAVSCYTQEEARKKPAEEAQKETAEKPKEAAEKPKETAEKPGEVKPEEGDTKATEMTLEQKKSYLIGMTMAGNLKNNFKRMNYNILAEFVIKGFIDSMKNNKSKLSNQEVGLVNAAIMKDLKERQAKNNMAQDKQGQKNLEEGKTFLAENGKKEGIKTTESGLQYQVITEGEGASPQATDMVKVHYQGTLISGTEFDSSYKRGKPAEFKLNQVIKGWTEGVQLMKVGSKYRFFIPSELAYGPRGAGQIIGPNSTLIFVVELLGIIK